MVCALCASVFAVLFLIVALFKLFEGTVNDIMDLPAKWGINPPNPVLGAIGAFVWVLALIFWAPTATVPPWVFLGLAVLLATVAVGLCITDRR